MNPDSQDPDRSGPALLYNNSMFVWFWCIISTSIQTHAGGGENPDLVWEMFLEFLVHTRIEFGASTAFRSRARVICDTRWKSDLTFICQIKDGFDIHLPDKRWIQHSSARWKMDLTFISMRISVYRLRESSNRPQNKRGSCLDIER